GLSIQSRLNQKFEGEDAMERLDRRSFIKLSGGVMTAGMGGMAGILASGRAPAHAQGTTLHWLRWNDFCPASDQLLRRGISAECEQALGVKIKVRSITANEMRAS